MNISIVLTHESHVNGHQGNSCEWSTRIYIYRATDFKVGSQIYNQCPNAKH